MLRPLDELLLLLLKKKTRLDHGSYVTDQVRMIRSNWEMENVCYLVIEVLVDKKKTGNHLRKWYFLYLANYSARFATQTNSSRCSKLMHFLWRPPTLRQRKRYMAFQKKTVHLRIQKYIVIGYLNFFLQAILLLSIFILLIYLPLYESIY